MLRRRQHPPRGRTIIPAYLLASDRLLRGMVGRRNSVAVKTAKMEDCARTLRHSGSLQGSEETRGVSGQACVSLKASVRQGLCQRSGSA